MIDGVIKYQLEHQYEETSKCLDYAEVEALRSRLFALGLIGQKDGVGYGNLSCRQQLSEQFFITSTQTGEMAELSSSHYSLVEAYDFESFKLYSKGEFKPSSEALSHAMIYALNPAVQAVIHIHSYAVWRFMLATGQLTTTAEYGTVAMVEEIFQLYQDSDLFQNPAFVMQGHQDGVVVFGRSLKEAELALYSIIKSCLKAPV
ncbi:MAG: class II aldolase/adducin family protein [Mariprofundaceae bacterium]